MLSLIQIIQMIISGELDSFSEQAFYLVGNIDEATAKAATFQVED